MKLLITYLIIIPIVVFLVYKSYRAAWPHTWTPSTKEFWATRKQDIIQESLTIIFLLFLCFSLFIGALVSGLIETDKYTIQSSKPIYEYDDGSYIHKNRIFYSYKYEVDGGYGYRKDEEFSNVVLIYGAAEPHIEVRKPIFGDLRDWIFLNVADTETWIFIPNENSIKETQ